MKIFLLMLFFFSLYSEGVFVEKIEKTLFQSNQLYDFFKQCFDESGHFMTAEQHEDVIGIILENKDYQTVLVHNNKNKLVGFMTWYYFVPHNRESRKICYDNDRISIDEINTEDDNHYFVHIPLLKIINSHQKKGILKEVISKSIEIIKKDYKHRTGRDLEKIYFGVFNDNTNFLRILENLKNVKSYEESKTCIVCIQVRTQYEDLFNYFSANLNS